MRGWKTFFWCAAAFNVLIGVALMIFPGNNTGHDFGSGPLPVRAMGWFIAVFGIGYAIVANAPERHRGIIKLGVIGKLGFVVMMLFAWNAEQLRTDQLLVSLLGPALGGGLRHSAAPGGPLMKITSGPVERHTLSVTVDNESGVLARIAGMFSARGYNIESLTVADISDDDAVSRITIVTTGTPQVIEQVVAQLDRLVPVHRVVDLTLAGEHIERELALVKVAGAGEMRIEALRLADVFRAKPVDTTTSSFVFELTGSSSKIDRFVALMGEIGLVEVARTGIVAMARGREAF